MEYIALYRKYRPDRFSDIIGQENITSILKNQIKNNKVSHAYLFSGTRGTGKTTAAKIFARAINCIDSSNGEPCNVCEACKSILSGESTDVVEMDAASNNSVENIRQIRSEVIYASTSVKYRVYIIDEVHMLTTSAFNALLKTLEEPPSNVIFILATTEQHKIPVTILSRCLRFEFSKIPLDKIKERIIHILDLESLKYEKEAIDYIAKLADGALRDALSILERCLTEEKDTLKLSSIEEIIGATNKEIIDALVESVLNSDSITIINTIDKVVEKGKDLRQLIYSLTEAFLDILIEAEDKKSIDMVANIIDEISKLDNEIRLSSKPTILIKSSLIRIGNSINTKQTTKNIIPVLEKNNLNKDINNENINKINNEKINKIDKLENEINKIHVMIEKLKRPNKTNENNTKQEKNIEDNLAIEKIKPFDKYKEFKESILSKGNIKIYSTLVDSKMYIADDSTIIVTGNEYSYKIISDLTQKEAIAKLLNEEYGINKPLIIKLQKKNTMTKIEKILTENNIGYTNLD